jgi:Tol biopolymer transport system component
VLLAACGRLHFDARADAQDVASGPFGAPVQITEVNSATQDSDPALTGDMLEMYFDSDRPGLGTSDIWRATRSSVDAPWDPPMLVSELDTASFDGAPGITTDGLVMLFTSDRPGGLGGFDLWQSSRASRADAWATPALVAELSSNKDDSNPQPSPDGLVVWFSSTRGGATARQLYRATRPTTGSPWSTPIEVTELDIAPDVTSEAPWFSSDELDVFFASNRAGGAGANDVWHAARANAGVPFDAPTPVVELNSPVGENDPWLSPDRHVIVYSSKRGGDDNLYMAMR